MLVLSSRFSATMNPVLMCLDLSDKVPGDKDLSKLAGSQFFAQLKVFNIEGIFVFLFDLIFGNGALGLDAFVQFGLIQEDHFEDLVIFLYGSEVQ